MKFHTFPFSKIKENLKDSRNNLSTNTISYLIKSFSPMNPVMIETYNSFVDKRYFETGFLVTTKRIDYYFTLYLLGKLAFMKDSDNLSEFNFLKFREMISKFL